MVNWSSTVRPAADGLRRAGQAWNAFWYTPDSPVVLGLMRICCGLVLLYVHLSYSCHLQDWVGRNAWVDLTAADAVRHEDPIFAPPPGWEAPQRAPLPDNLEEKARILRYYNDWGVDVRETYARGHYLWSLWFHVTDPTWMTVLNVVALAIFVLFTLGLGGRVTSLLAWLAAITYLHRAPPMLFGLDATLNLALLYLTIGPSTAALSLDRLLSRWRTTRQALRRRQPAPVLAGPAARADANFALRLFQLHFCLMYLVSGLAKLLGVAWWNGDAMWGFLAGQRWLLETVQAGGVLYTFAVEIGFPFLVWNRRWRGVMIVGSVLLHFGIALSLDLAIFSMMMMTLVAAFFPTATVQRFLRLLGRGSEAGQLRYDSRVPSQARWVSVVRAVDVWEQVALLDTTTEPGRLQLVGADGSVVTGYAVGERLVRKIRLLWPMALLTWLPGVAAFGRALWPERDVAAKQAVRV
jgi:hypothetical protein